MQQQAAPTKSTRHMADRAERDASAGPQGIAIKPPAYGIDVVDSAPIQAVTADTSRGPGVASMSENRTGLPDRLKSGIEQLSGLSMGDVKVHYNSDKPAQLQAHAYAQGTDIHVASGQERHLPHEAWHVVQQKQGRVKPTMQLKGEVNISDDTGLEKEADVMGDKSLKLSIQVNSFDEEAIQFHSYHSNNVVQCFFESDFQEFNQWKRWKKSYVKYIGKNEREIEDSYDEFLEWKDYTSNYDNFLKWWERREQGMSEMEAHEETVDMAEEIVKFETQQMVPSLADMKDLKARTQKNPTLTPSQNWALLAAEKKSKLMHDANLQLAKNRLKDLNNKFELEYDESELPAILKKLRSQPIVTNYHFESAPGSNTVESDEDTPLYKLMLKSETFKNLWETGVSQAAANQPKRGAIEEQMGYGLALGRLEGEYGNEEGKFNPRSTYVTKSDDSEGDHITLGPSEMPKYGALVSKFQKHGVAQRYGNSYIVWKDQIRSRVTHTPGDSWSGWGGPQGVQNYTSNDHPEALFAHSDIFLLRLAAGEATNWKKDSKLKEEIDKKSGLAFEGYAETQIHGDLKWSDVQEIVIGWGPIYRPGNIGEGMVKISDLTEEGAMEIKKEFEQFASQKSYDFIVHLKKQ